ncbi:MFS transporter [Sphingomonas tabacisoli]|uniref:MFS transporter n=1 Tax=Sphingomonas tabacisoli TaxID=2249466 RepID=A0ABW4I6J4_9SPHN
MTGERVTLGTKLSYGFGAIAYGIKDNGFQVFLLIFYNQVVGLPADQVGLAILIALIVDALIDPAVGVLSDRTDTRWGRRHPWLYGSALPILIAWLLLWNPPVASHSVQFAWLLAVAIGVRLALSTNEVPSIALVPEMTRDYHERTSILRYRYLFGWGGGLAMLMLAYGVLLAPANNASPALAAQGYSRYGLAGGLIMAASVLLSALGTHRRYARRSPYPVARHGIGETLRNMRATLSNRAFLTLMAAALFAFANQGIAFAMSNYVLTFVWLFSKAEFFTYSLALFAGVVGAFFGVTLLNVRFGKRATAAACSLISAGLGTLPYWLKLSGVAVPHPLFLLLVGASTGFGVAVMISTGSMVADVVEASQAETGRREEGLFAAGYFFMQKSVTGVGIFLSGVVLTLIGFPPNAVPGRVDPAVIERLITVFPAVTVAIAAISAVLYMRFPIGRADHEARLAKLAVASAESGGNP